jgi:hypothetical protein
MPVSELAGTSAAPALRAALPAARGRAGLGGALRSELTKLRSTRSTWWALLALVVVTIGFGALASAGAANDAATHGAMGPGFDPTQRSLGGLYIGQLVIAVLGALTITSEYSTGMIRTSLAAMPRRGTFFAAKAIVFGLVALVTGLVACFGAFFVGQAIMSGQHINATLSQPHVLRAVIGGALFLTICGLLAFGLGMVLRHTAGAITAAMGLLFVLFVVVNFLPESWQVDIDKWIPVMAGSQVWGTKAVTDSVPMFSAWAGFGVLAGYAAIALIAGILAFRRRDA